MRKTWKGWQQSSDSPASTKAPLVPGKVSFGTLTSSSTKENDLDGTSQEDQIKPD
jgi:hypothetical protein